MKLRALAASMSALLVVSCSGGELTEILVVVDTDIPIPAGLDAVRVEVTGTETVTASGSLVGAGAMTLPRTVGVVRTGGSLGPIAVRVVGSVGGSDAVEARASTSFIAGRTLVLPMFLSSACRTVPCGPTETCANASCVSSAVDPATLADYSGTVGRLDAGRPSCIPETEACDRADDDCDGRVDEDFDLLGDEMNCGACGSRCVPARAVGECVAGTCTITSCGSGFADCDGDVANGCEDDLTTTANCAVCGTACTVGQTCTGGSCTGPICAPGTDDCDADASNGCETALDTLTDCGACGVACGSPDGPTSCATGACVITSCTDTTTDDCDGDATTGCETSLDTLTDCSACGVPCDFAGATESCATGSCVFGTCDALLDDCDSDTTNGCEQALTTLSDCGSCGTACTITNGTGTCATGTCEVFSCITNRGDCDMDASNGCERDLRFDESNCGTCGMVCPATETCRTGRCRP
jgi:hypothetical protein